MKTISQLYHEQRWLSCALDRGRFEDSPEKAEEALRRIEDIDLAIAATPVSTAEELWIKAFRLRDSLGLATASSHEAALMNALVDDCARLARLLRKASLRQVDLQNE